MTTTVDVRQLILAKLPRFPSVWIRTFYSSDFRGARIFQSVKTYPLTKSIGFTNPLVGLRNKL